MSTNTQKLGRLIRELRKRHDMTQGEFAQALNTSQSAVARMEKGGQNFSTNELLKISEVLGTKLINIAKQDDFIVYGGQKLSGSVKTNPSKNGATGLFAASLLNKGTTILHNIPRIEEINRMIEIYSSIGVSVRWIGDKSVEIKVPKTFSFDDIDVASARKVRSSLMMIGALVHHSYGFSLPHAGGCNMGERIVSAHHFGLKEFGITIETEAKSYVVHHSGLNSADITLYEASDTATENLLICASGIEGTTTLHFAQQNYMVMDVCYFLEKLGVRFEGLGSHTLKVTGVSNIRVNVEYTNSEDPIESMMFISAGIVTQSEILIQGAPIDYLRLELLKLKHMGLLYKIENSTYAANGKTALVDITIYPSKLIALSEKIHALPYPGINSDNLPFFVPIATQTEGITLIHDWMWENRAIYFTELNRLGANIRLADPHRVYIEGKTQLFGSQIVCPPALRPSMMILVAMLGAEGRSTLRNVYSIKRGYENIVERLNSLGANITIDTGL